MTKKLITLVLMIGIVLSLSKSEIGNSRGSEKLSQIEKSKIMNEDESEKDEKLATVANEGIGLKVNITETTKKNVKKNIKEKSSKKLESKVETAMQMSVSANGTTIVYELNDSQAAKELYEQLPLSVEVEKFSNNEKIFYPPVALVVSNTPLASGGGAGVIAYYAPWGDVVMYYDSFEAASGLYELGQIVSGSEYIKSMSGTIRLTKTNE